MIEGSNINIKPIEPILDVKVNIKNDSNNGLQSQSGFSSFLNKEKENQQNSKSSEDDLKKFQQIILNKISYLEHYVEDIEPENYMENIERISKCYLLFLKINRLSNIKLKLEQLQKLNVDIDSIKEVLEERNALKR